MPRNISGEFTPLHDWEDDEANDIPLSSERLNAQHADIAEAINDLPTPATIIRRVDPATAPEDCTPGSLKFIDGVAYVRGDDDEFIEIGGGHEARTDNPHGVTKAQVGLGNVDNTSDAAKPVSAATQTALSTINNTMDAAIKSLAFGSLLYDERSELFADLNPADRTSAWVIADPTNDYNGIYRKNGASGFGTWTKVMEYPDPIQRFNNAGAGTANAIQATSPTNFVKAPYAYFGILNITHTTTSSTVTLSVNGEAPKQIVRSDGTLPAAGTFVAGGMVVLTDDGVRYRLTVGAEAVNAASAAAVSAAAALASENAAAASEAAAAASEDSANEDAVAAAAAALAAIGAANSAGPVTIFATKAAATAALASVAADAVIEVSVDESQGGARVRYRKTGGVYVLERVMDLYTQLPVFATRAAASALNLTGVTGVVIARWDSASILWPAVYAPEATEPTHSQKFQSLDGQWWGLAETMVTPGMCGAPAAYLDDASVAAQRAIDMVRASYNPTSGQFARWVSLGGRMWKIGTSLNATNIRQAGMTIVDGGFYGTCSGRAILDLSGTQGVRSNISFHGDETTPPLCAVLLCRAEFPASSGFFGGAGLHDLEEIEIKGFYSGAALINYGAEVVRYPRRPVWNNFKTTGRAAMIITGESQYLVKWMGVGAGAGGSAVVSNYATLPSGGVSCINHLFSTFDIRRISAWGALPISSISKASPGVITLTSATTKIANGNAFYVHDFVGMDQMDRSTYFLKKIDDTTYEIYTNVGLTTPLDTSGFTDFVSGNLWAATGPALILAGGVKQISRLVGYILTYGGDGIIIDSEYTVNEINDIEISVQHEARPGRTVRYVTPQDATVTHHNHVWKFLNATQDWKTSVFGVEPKGTGEVNLRNAEIDIPKWTIAPTLGLVAGSGDMRMIQCDISMPDAATAFNANAFASRFTGSVEDYTTNTVREYTDQLTYLPELKFDGSAAGISYTTRSGWYERRGNLVTVYFRLDLNTMGAAASGAVATITLPVAAGQNGVVSVARYSNLVGASPLSGEVTAGSSEMTLYVHGTVNSTALTKSYFNPNSALRGMVTYMTAL